MQSRTGIPFYEVKQALDERRKSGNQAAHGSLRGLLKTIYLRILAIPEYMDPEIKKDSSPDL